MRRAALAAMLAGGLITPLTVPAQQPAKVARIGYVSTNLAVNGHMVEAFRQGLRDLGYVEGRNLVIEFRSADGQLDRFPELVSDLIGLKVDVIVTANTRAALAAKHATDAIPIVFAGVADPISSGLVASLARPGGNVTGVSAQGPELVGKGLELLKQAVPRLTHVAALWHRDYDERTQRGILVEADRAGQRLGLRLRFVEARGGPESFESAFADVTRARSDALTVLTSVLFISERKRLVELAARHRLPTLYAVRDFVDEGGLMSYGPRWADAYRRAARHVDKILKGARPGDLPVEQPTTFELVLNLKTARTLGLTIPPRVVQRADEVLE